MLHYKCGASKRRKETTFHRACNRRRLKKPLAVYLLEPDEAPLDGYPNWEDITHDVNTSAGLVATAIAAAALPAAVHSPGYLAVGYGNAFRRHKMRVRLCYGADPGDIGIMTSEAEALATALAYVVCNTMFIDEFFVYDDDGHLLYGTLLPSVHPGRVSPSGENSNSMTWTIVGHGQTVVNSHHTGIALARWFSDGSTVVVPRGTKYGNIPTEVGMAVLAQALAVSSYIWADFWGAKAGIRQFVPFQYNASAQRREGK